MANVSRRFLGCLGLALPWTLALPWALAATAFAGPLDDPGYPKAFSCSACHGFAGNSRSDAMPILAGQLPAYLKKALQDYAAGKRPSPEMEPYAKMAIELGIDDVVRYFASQTKVPTAIVADRAAIDRGKTAAAPCTACHGPTGKGDAARGIPDLSGQPPGYLTNQLLLFKADRRNPGEEAVMQPKAIIRALPDATLEDIAAYYSSLR